LRGLRRGLLRWHRGGNAIDQIQWREVQFVDLGAALVRARLAVLFCAAAHQGGALFAQGGPVHMGRPGAVGLQSLRNHPQEDAQHHVEHCPITLHEVAQPLGHREHPLAHRQPEENMIAEVCRSLHHAPGVARGADAPAFAGIGQEVVVPAVITPGSGKAVGKDAAFQIFAKGLADIGLGVWWSPWPSNWPALANSNQVSKCSAMVW
jgi:hypothetical protein